MAVAIDRSFRSLAAQNITIQNNRETEEMAHLFTSSTTLEVGTPPPSCTRSSFNVLFHRFVDISAERGQCVHSPEFEHNGRKWRLRFYPGGDNAASEGFVSVYLELRSEGSCEVAFDIFFRA